MQISTHVLPDALIKIASPTSGGPSPHETQQFYLTIHNLMVHNEAMPVFPGLFALGTQEWNQALVPMTLTLSGIDGLSRVWTAKLLWHLRPVKNITFQNCGPSWTDFLLDSLASGCHLPNREAEWLLPHLEVLNFDYCSKFEGEKVLAVARNHAEAIMSGSGVAPTQMLQEVYIFPSLSGAISVKIESRLKEGKEWKWPQA